MKKEEKIIEIQEEVEIPGTDIVLEKGDRFKVLNEGSIIGRLDTSNKIATYLNTLRDKGLIYNADDFGHDLGIYLVEYIMSFNDTPEEQEMFLDSVISSIKQHT